MARALGLIADFRTDFFLPTAKSGAWITPDDALTQRSLKVLALASYPEEAAATRFRILQFIGPLAERQITVDFGLS